MRARALAAALTALVLGAGFAAVAEDEARPAARKARGVFVEYDSDAGTLSVRERGRLETYALLDPGAAAETEVSIESEPARVSDLEPGAPVIVTWRLDADDRERRVALRIEAPAIPKSFHEGLR